MREYKRIAFCGASGTGKTTLATWLAEKLGLPLNPVGSRSVAKSMGFDSPYDVDRADLAVYSALLALEEDSPRRLAALQAMEHYNKGDENCRTPFQEELLKQKVAWELKHLDGFVTDRTTVDNFVYAAMHNPQGLTTEYMEQAAAQLAHYDVIFFTGTAAFHNLADDPHRVGELAYHYAFELFCDGTLVNWLGNDWNEKVRYVTQKALLRRQLEVAQCLHLDDNGGHA
jgi:cytidylate kinase